MDEIVVSDLEGNVIMSISKDGVEIKGIVKDGFVVTVNGERLE